MLLTLRRRQRRAPREQLRLGAGAQPRHRRRGRHRRRSPARRSRPRSRPTRSSSLDRLMTLGRRRSATRRTWRPRSSARRRPGISPKARRTASSSCSTWCRTRAPPAANLRVRYLRPSGAPIVKTYTVGAGSRFTIWVDQEDAALADTDVSAEITSTNGVPIIVERSMYLNTPGQGVQGRPQQRRRDRAGDELVPRRGRRPAASSRCSCCSPTRTTQAATLRATYLRGERRADREDLHAWRPNSRHTIDVAQAGSEPRATRRWRCKVESTNGVAGHRRAHDVVAERGPAAGRKGTTRSARRARRRAGCWRKARAAARASISTFVLIANTSAADANVKVTMLRESGAEESRDLHRRRQPPLHRAGRRATSRRPTASASRSWSRA